MEEHPSNRMRRDLECGDQPNLPLANIEKIMKKTSNESLKISKTAKEALQEYLTEFITFVSAEGMDYCKNDGRRTLTGRDILKALKELGFTRYQEILAVYLDKFETAIVSAPFQPRINKEPFHLLQCLFFFCFVSRSACLFDDLRRKLLTLASFHWIFFLCFLSSKGKYFTFFEKNRAKEPPMGKKRSLEKTTQGTRAIKANREKNKSF